MQPQVIIFHKGGRDERRSLAGAGEAPRDFYYGFLAAEAAGYRVHWESTAKAYDERFGGLRRWGERVHSALTGMAWRPYALDRMGATLDQAQLAISFTDHFSLSLGRWNLGRRRPVHSVGLFCSLSDIEERLPAHARPYARWYIRRAASGLDGMGFFGDADRQWSIRRYNLDPARTFVFDFGVDTAFWSPSPGPTPHDGRVLAVGSDRNRDYNILVRAELGHPLRLITRLPVSVPPDRTEVELLRGSFDRAAVTDVMLRDFYRAAMCVTVAMTDCRQPSGQSVTLQAMSCGAPVILSRIEGLWAPELLRDGENCLLVPPGDVDALRGAVRRIATDTALRERLCSAGRRTALEHFSLLSGERAALRIVGGVPGLLPGVA